MTKAVRHLGTPQVRGRPEGDIPVGTSADRPIPSIEKDSDNSSDENNITTPAPSSTTQEGHIAFDVTNAKGKNVLREGPESESLGSHLENMRLSSPDSGLDMSAVADLERAASPSRNSLLEPRYPGTEDRPSRPSSVSRRRRSSSRVDTTPHDVREEEPPQDRFHEPAFQQAMRDARQLMSELTDALGSSSLYTDPDSTMLRLHREAGSLAHFQCSSSRTVGFVGDSGVGKSSLLNSLLDSKELARASNSGAACTCVVTEYHYHDSSDFAVETELFSIDEITEQITELLHSYRHYHLHNMDMNDEKKDFEERAGIARDTFGAMFRGRLDSDQFLTEWPEDAVLETLRSWTQESDSYAIGGRQVMHTLADCSALLMHLTSEQTSTQEPASWPYVRKIKVFLKAHILSKGLVLVDLPGLRDLNSARRHITERYLLHCDEIFVICNIGRATTDAGVMSVFELARQAKLSNVGIICTKSDDIRAEEAKRDWKGTRARDIQKLIDAVARDQLDLEIVNGQIAEYDGADSDFSEGEKDMVLRFHRRSTKTKKLLDDHQFELKKYLVNTRNNSVTDKLNDLYKNRISDATLKVFCVSNTEYWEYRDKLKDVAIPHLQLSGILTVRRHCIAMVAESQLRIATKYIQDSIPALLGDVELWVQSGAGSVSAERKQAARETLDVLEARLRMDLTGTSSQTYGIARSMKQEFKTQIYDKRHVNSWTRGAGKAAHEWSGWSHQTYMAFCRKYGHYYTPTVNSHNWNEEAIESMVEEVAAPWQSLRLAVQNLHESTATSIEKLMDRALAYLDIELQSFIESTATLSQAFTSRQHLLAGDVEEVCEKFEADLSTLRTDALSGIRSSLIGQAMEKSYSACIDESGRDSDSRRKKIINDKLNNEFVFENLMKEFKNKFNALADGLQSSMEAAIEKHLEDIRKTLDIVRSDNAATESEQDPAFRGRVEAEIGIAKNSMRDIHAAIAI